MKLADVRSIRDMHLRNMKENKCLLATVPSPINIAASKHTHILTDCIYGNDETPEACRFDTVHTWNDYCELAVALHTGLPLWEQILDR